MPLYMPNEHKPDLSVSDLVELKCRDADDNHVVPVVVSDLIFEAHAIALGWKEPLGNYDRTKLVRDALERVVQQASETYDACGKPRVVALQRLPSLQAVWEREITPLRPTGQRRGRG